MTIAVILDSSPLGLLANTNQANPDAVDCAEWLKSLLLKGVDVYVPEVADYEVRRSLLKIDATTSISKLNQLNSVLIYQPITTEAMREASNYWATARKIGKPTADDKSLDADMVLVGQASTISGNLDQVIVATTNIKHIDNFIEARKWQDIVPDELLNR
ncbi:hypothetical protein [Thiohalophilus sp.]|uniref:hypothetical protein n=1 Tax=Thiohalophilus sp. TaxID=3028392 RepID=UPI002ACE648B|nr:hypothetical protein [Thiohalophilus sp.]MDZ7805370.1 hypothetical protein [Thiohalophilus sp.]